MFSENVAKKIENISNKLAELGYDYLREDLIELLTEREDILQRVEEIKYNKIEFFKDEQNKSVGFTLSDVQVEFLIETGIDDEGPWYEATAELLFFGGED